MQFYILGLKVQRGSRETEHTDFTLPMCNIGKRGGRSTVFFVICVVSKVSRMSMEGKSPVLVSHAFCWLGLSTSDAVKCKCVVGGEHAAVVDAL